MRDSFIDEGGQILLVGDMRDRGVDAMMGAVVRGNLLVEVEMGLLRYWGAVNGRKRLEDGD